MEQLRYGSSGPNVELLQLGLNRAGYLYGGIDGIFGPGTRNAVMLFQRQYGLSADGIVGNKTWNALASFLRGYTTYTIRRGDTFFELAKRFGTTAEAIGTANPGADPTNLSIGMRIIIPYGFPVVPTNISFTSVVLSQVLTGLAARYPFLRRGQYGSSVMGKQLHWISIGGGGTEVFYNAAHHGNEWITTPVVLRFLEEYAQSYASGGSIYGIPAARLYNKTRLYIAPMVNPDGVDLASGLLRSGSYYSQAKGYAANYPAVPFPAGWKANISGVDPNLQYPAAWEAAREIKFAQGYTRPGPRDYVGSAPLSAQESRAAYNFTRARNFALTLSYHSQGEIIYWKFKDFLPPRSYEIGRRLSDASGYSLEDTPYASANAGYKDWFIQDYDRPGYTIEVGLGSNPLPLSQFERIYADNIGIMALGMDLAQ